MRKFGKLLKVLGVLLLVGPFSLLLLLNLLPPIVSNDTGWMVGYVATFGAFVYVPVSIALMLLGSWLAERD